jgi:hypothetical protein
MVANSSALRSAVVETYRETLSAEENVNLFLDLINEAKTHYSDLNNHWSDLNLKMESFVSESSSIDDLTFILISVEGLISKADSLLAKIKSNQQHYLAIKTQIDLLEDTIEISNELCEDIKIKVDPQMIALGNQLDNL